MSLSEKPVVNITFDTAQEISDEIMGGTIKFCVKYGYKQDLMVLTLFWSAFLFSAKEELVENDLVEEVINRCPYSFGCIFRGLINDEVYQEKVKCACKQCIKNFSNDFSLLNTKTDFEKLFECIDRLIKQDDESCKFENNEDMSNDFMRVSSVISSNVYRILRKMEEGIVIQYKYVVYDLRSKIDCKEHAPEIHKNVFDEHRDEEKAKGDVGIKRLGMRWYNFLCILVFLREWY